jgi:hypothetical protein
MVHRLPIPQTHTTLENHNDMPFLKIVYGSFLGPPTKQKKSTSKEP